MTAKEAISRKIVLVATFKLVLLELHPVACSGFSKWIITSKNVNYLIRDYHEGH
ncbi:MAG: hypothetical protein ACTSP4_16375 [Candidatus Hodarchaeales archaeon]